MEFNFNEMKQDELIEYVKPHGDVSSQDFEVEDFSWQFTNVSIEELLEKNKNGTDENGWLEWIDIEQKGRLSEWGYDSVQQIAEYWLENSEQEPIVAARMEDGKIEIWDGYHRFDIAVRNKLENVPVILGEIKHNKIH